MKEGWAEKAARGSGQLGEEGPGLLGRGGRQGPAGCGVAIRGEEGLAPAAFMLPPLPPPLSPQHFSPPFLCLLYNSPFFFPSSTLPYPPHFSRPLPSPQSSGPSQAEPSTRRASAAACPELGSFCGAEKRVAAAAVACAAPWRSRKRAAAPRTAPLPAPRRSRGAAPAARQSGCLIRPPTARGPHRPGFSSPPLSPSRSPGSRPRSRRLATAPRALGPGCACGGPGEAQGWPRTRAGPHLLCGRRVSFERAREDGRDL